MTTPPEQFNFLCPDGWSNGSADSKLTTKSEECQVNILIYTMRDEADDIRGHCDPISDTMYDLRVLIKVPY